MNRRTQTTSLCLSALACLMVPASVLAQPAGEPMNQPPQGDGPGMRERGPNAGPGPGQGGMREPMPTDPALLREFLSRRLGELERSQARMRDALAALDRKEDPEQIVKNLREGMREGLRDNLRPRRQDGPGGPEGPGADRGPDRGPDGDKREASAPSPMSEIMPPIGGGPRLSPDERQRVRDFIAQHKPEINARIDELAGKNPEMADRLTDGLGARLKGLRDLRERDPEEFDLRVEELKNSLEILQHGRAVVEGQRAKKPDAEIAASKSLLRGIMDKQFDVRAALQVRQIDMLRKRLDKLQAELDTAKSNRDKTIDEKMAQFLSAMERGPGKGRGPGRGRTPSGPDGPATPPNADGEGKRPPAP